MTWLAALLAIAQPGEADVTVAIVDLPEGAPYVDDPSLCAPDVEGRPDGSLYICLAELYRGRLRVREHLAGPVLTDGDELRIVAHARRFAPGARLLVATIPYSLLSPATHRTIWFAYPDDNGEFCARTDELEEDAPVSVVRLFQNGRSKQSTVGLSQQIVSYCIRDQTAR